MLKCATGISLSLVILILIATPEIAFIHTKEGDHLYPASLTKPCRRRSDIFERKIGSNLKKLERFSRGEYEKLAIGKLE